MRTEFFRCDCLSPEHQMLIDKDDEGIIYISFHLTDCRTFGERLKWCIKYLFGYKSRYGAWDELILREEDKERLKNLLN